METLVLNGKEYVKASKAAKDLGYTSDYVGQLCRGGSVDAHLVGRTWYVNPDTLTNHKVEKKRNARVKAREYAKKAIEESRSLKINRSKNSYKNIAIRYEDDSEELIPAVRKVPVEATSFPVLDSKNGETDTASYKIENENKKVIMSGVLDIQDADEEALVTDTIVLTPSFRKIHHNTKVEETNNPEKIEETQQKAPVNGRLNEEISFIDRLVQYDADGKSETNTLEKEDQITVAPQQSMKSGSGAMYYVSILILMLLSGLSIFIEQNLTSDSISVTTSYSINPQSINTN